MVRRTKINTAKGECWFCSEEEGGSWMEGAKMNKITIGVLVFFVVNLLPNFSVFGASFNCPASTKTEKAICVYPDLSALDDMMAIVWENYKEKLNSTFQ